MDDARTENRVRQVYAARSNEELQARYDEWADEYDRDLERDFGYRAPWRAVEEFNRHVSSGARVLDVGAGTGLVGVELRKAGFDDITAIDLSEGMLERAQATGAYRELRRSVLGERLDFDDDTFDASIAVGVFTAGHAPAVAFDELARITRPGGHLVATIRADTFSEAGFDTQFRSMEAAGTIEPVAVTEPEQLLPKGEPDILHRIHVLRVR